MAENYVGRILKGAQTGRRVGAAGNEIHTDHQSEDRRVARHHILNGPARARRRGDRVDWRGSPSCSSDARNSVSRRMSVGGHFETKSDGYRCKSIGLILPHQLTFWGSAGRRRVRLVHLSRRACLSLRASFKFAPGSPSDLVRNGGFTAPNAETIAPNSRSDNSIRSRRPRELGRGRDDYSALE